MSKTSAKYLLRHIREIDRGYVIVGVSDEMTINLELYLQRNPRASYVSESAFLITGFCDTTNPSKVFTKKGPHMFEQKLIALIVLQYVALCFIILDCVAVCCIVLYYIGLCSIVLHSTATISKHN